MEPREPVAEPRRRVGRRGSPSAVTTAAYDAAIEPGEPDGSGGWAVNEDPDPWEERLRFGQLFLRHLDDIRPTVPAAWPAADHRSGLPGDAGAQRDAGRGRPQLGSGSGLLPGRGLSARGSHGPGGAVIAVVRFGPSHPYQNGHNCSPWAMGSGWHWPIESVAPLALPVPCKGALSFWRLQGAALAAVKDQAG